MWGGFGKVHRVVDGPPFMGYSSGMQFDSAKRSDLRGFRLPPDWIWHASHIKSYQNCAYQFAWEYLAKSEEVECWGPNKEAWFGTALHAALEWLYLKRPGVNETGEIFNVFAGVFYDDGVALERSSRELVAAWAARRGISRCVQSGTVGCPTCGNIGYVIPRWALYGYESPDDAIRKYVDGISTLRKYINSHRDWIDPNMHTWPEYRFSFNWLGRKFEGTMDRVDNIEGTDQWSVVDYKTGLRDDVDASKHDIQKWLYTLAVISGMWPDSINENGRPDPEVLKKVRYDWQNATTEQRSVGHFNEKSWERQHKIVYDIITSAEAGNFQPSSSPLCGWCRILSCPMRERAYLHA